MADTTTRAPSPDTTRDDLAALAATPRPRALVPTTRERAEGGEAPTQTVGPELAPAPEPRGRRLRRSLRTYARSLDLRGTGAPAMPLLVFGLSAIFVGWDAQVLGLVAPEIRTEFGVSVADLVALGSVLGFLGILAALPMGYLVDRVKRVWLVRVGGIVGQVSIVLQALAGSFVGLVLARSVGFLGTTLAGPASGPLTADYFAPKLRGRVFAFLGACGQIGTLLSVPVAGVMVTMYGWRQAVIALAIPGTLFVLLSFLLREPTRGEVDRKDAGLSDEQAEQEPPPLSMTASLKAAWSIRTLRRQAYAGLVIGIVSGPIFLITGLFLADRFLLSPAERAWVVWIVALVATPGLLLAGPIADRLMDHKPSRLVVIQSLLMILGAVSLVVMVFAPGLVYVVAFQVVLGFASATVTPATAVLYARIVPAQFRGIGMQVYAPFAVVGLILAPFLTGYADQQWGTGGALLAMAPIYLFGGIMFLTSASSVERDIRAAELANIADQVVQAAKAAGTTKMIVCRGLEVEYAGTQVLFGIDLDVDEGETIALVGTNGAGKSTLMRAVCGLHEPANGAVFLDGVDVTHAPAHELARRGVVMLPGGHAVFPEMTVDENLRAAAWGGAGRAGGIPAEVFEAFPVLRQRLQQRAGTLSGGEQQMVAMAQAMLMRPRLLLIDELSLGLAPAVVDQLLTIVRRLRDEGTTIVLVEQSLNVALTVADRAVFMEKGEIRFDGPTRELLGRPDLVRAVFMGAVTGSAARRPLRRGAERATVLRADGIGAAFGGVRALHDVTLEAAAGEIVGVIGPNGAGKTTLFDVVSGYTRPDSGTVLLGPDLDDVTRLSPDARARAGLGRSFQSVLLFPALTVRETIALAHERRAVRSAVLAALWTPPVRRRERRIAERVDGLVDLLGLGAYADKFVRELSTGTRRAVEIACVMAAEPAVLLLDEPSSGLAQAEAETLGPALTRIVHDTGCALIVIEHDLPLVTSIADRLVAMDLGEVIADGDPAGVCADPKVVESYLSASVDTLQRSGSHVTAALAQAGLTGAARRDREGEST
ncbi:MFS transporter [Jiangella asiatica]|uniref:MFS transporter n=1 Tax=Jiangella asiatica TaxID=2530372 RepID=A0A4R5D8K8_9ACTN|nr:MFS transporter [Jiangella asiatica]TDE09899.1 MFS transporter [Jiangella asiatica]